MRTLKLTKDSQKNILESLLKRSPNNYTEYESTVNEIINNVKENRDKAVFEYTKKFDKADVDASNIRVTEEEIKEAYELVDEKLLAVIKKALVNIRKYHEKQLQNSWFTTEDGIILGQKVIASLGETDWSKYGLSAEDILSVIGEIPRDEQIKIIENSPVPEFLKNMLLENNNSTIYKELDVTSFPSYVASYISRLVLKVASFLVTFLLAIIIVKALMVAVNIIGELPVLGFVNHLAGGILGLLAALLIVWLIFLGLTLLYSTSVGHTCFGMIEKSVFLKFLYDHNPFLIRLLAF